MLIRFGEFRMDPELPLQRLYPGVDVRGGKVSLDPIKLIAKAYQ